MQILQKSLSILFLCTILTFTVQAQGTAPAADAEVIKTKKGLLDKNTTFKKPSKDYIMLQAGFHNWTLGTGANSIKLRQRGHDLAGYICYDFPLGKKSWSFAPGVGLASSNIFLDSTVASLKDTFIYLKFIPDSINDFKRYKMSTTYLEFPFEFRYFGNTDNRNRGFKASLGLKIGTLINAHNKGVGSVKNSPYREKETNKRYHEQWRIATTGRLGWGNFSIYGNYQLSNVFKTGNIQAITPYSIGICISGL
jgi:Outer membrane protein beta-barrel domain